MRCFQYIVVSSLLQLVTHSSSSPYLKQWNSQDNQTFSQHRRTVLGTADDAVIIIYNSGSLDMIVEKAVDRTEETLT